MRSSSGGSFNETSTVVSGARFASRGGAVAAAASCPPARAVA
jgi:hypothetical protein